MNNINELEERIKHIEKEIKQIDRLDRTVYELEQKLNKAKQLLIRIFETNEQINKNDLDYLLLKLNVEPIKYHELPSLITKTGILYKRTGEFPNFYKFHDSVILALSLTEGEEEDFSIEITESLLKKFIGTEENISSVCEKILSTK